MNSFLNLLALYSEIKYQKVTENLLQNRCSFYQYLIKYFNAIHQKQEHNITTTARKKKIIKKTAYKVRDNTKLGQKLSYFQALFPV